MKRLRWVPNVLSVLRLLLSIPLIFFLWQDQLLRALLILGLAAASDLADGFLARNYNWRSVLGSWLDPVADKTMITSVLITMTVKHNVPYWFCFLTVARDLALASGAILLLIRQKKFRIQPLISGKLATVGQNMALFLSLIRNRVDVSYVFLPVLVISAVVSVLSFIHYGRKYFKLVF